MLQEDEAGARQDPIRLKTEASLSEFGPNQIDPGSRHPAGHRRRLLQRRYPSSSGLMWTIDPFGLMPLKVCSIGRVRALTVATYPDDVPGRVWTLTKSL